MESSWMIEQQGKREGGKEPPSRSINQIFELFQSSKICLSGAKRLFRHAEAPAAHRAAGACRYAGNKQKSDAPKPALVMPRMIRGGGICVSK